MLELTAYGQQAAQAIVDRKVGFFDDGLEAESSTWSDCFSEEIAAALSIPQSSTPGIIGGLIKVGFFYGNIRGPEAVLALTPAGAAYCRALA